MVRSDHLYPLLHNFIQWRNNKIAQKKSAIPQNTANRLNLVWDSIKKLCRRIPLRPNTKYSSPSLCLELHASLQQTQDKLSAHTVFTLPYMSRILHAGCILIDLQFPHPVQLNSYCWTSSKMKAGINSACIRLPLVRAFQMSLDTCDFDLSDVLIRVKSGYFLTWIRLLVHDIWKHALLLTYYLLKLNGWTSDNIGVPF